MLLALVGLHVLVAAVAVPAARRLGRGVFWLCAVAPATTVAVAVAHGGEVLAGRPLIEPTRWVPGLDLTLDLRLDAFALVMVLLVAGIGVLVLAYSARYFSAEPQARAANGRFAATLLCFAGAMLGLVLADDLFALYVFWELTTVTSYLLIGHHHERGSTRAAALQGLLTTGAGSLVMLAGFVLLSQAAGTSSLSGIVASPPTGALAGAGALLALGGAVTKSAQVPFHTWLPGAMAAPTPVSAYLHSATMVKAGVYLVARLATPFAAVVPAWRPLLVGVGVATMLVGGYRALRQHDLKLLLAHGTVSQLGFLMVLFGVGTPEATTAGVALLVAHAAFKGTLFLVVGVIDHQAHTRDLRRLAGLGRRMPGLAAIAVLAGASMAGLPPLIGFIAKEAAFEAFLHAGLGALGVVALAGIVLGSLLTAAYTGRFLWGAFGGGAGRVAAVTATAAVGDGTARGLPPSRTVGPRVPLPAPSFVAPAALLALLSLLAGLAPGLVSPLVTAGAGALDGAAVTEEPLALFHGLNLALALSVVAVGGGAALLARGRWVEAAQGRVPRLADADDAYRAALRGLIRVADRVTGTLQNGSLPVYLGVILIMAVALPGTALLGLDALPRPEALADSPLQVAVALAVAAAAVGTAVTQHRFTAVLLLGGVGYGVAVLFVLHGAPDLALTQLLVETLVLVVFVLVLRHLPAEFDSRHWRLGQALRRVVAGAVGLFVTVFALAAGAARTARPVSDEYLARALPQAEGRNVVNVILVDFRSLDTVGEITVLTVAALGIAGLVRACVTDRRRAEAHDRSDRASAPARPSAPAGPTRTGP